MVALPTISQDLQDQLKGVMQHFGVEDDLTAENAVALLSKISVALGPDGVSFGQGQPIDLDDFMDPAKRAEIMQNVEQSVTGFQESPYAKFVNEALKGASALDRGYLSEQLTEMGIPRPGMIALTLQGMLRGQDPNAVVPQLWGMVEGAVPELVPLRENLGQAAIANLGGTIDILTQSDDWFEVIEAVGVALPAGATPAPATPAVTPTPSSGIDPVGRADAAARAAMDDRYAQQQAADAASAAAQAVIDQHIAQNQAVAPTSATSTPAPLNPAAQAAIDQHIAQNQAVAATPPTPPPATLSEVQDAVFQVEVALKLLSPVVQRGLDEQRAYNEGLIGDGSAFKDFVNAYKLGSFPGSGTDDFIDSGYQGLRDAVTAPMLKYFDVPEQGVMGDGILDMNDQAALQGVLYLFSAHLGIFGDDNWKYSPELGQRILQGIDKANFDTVESTYLSMLDLETEEGLAEKAEYDALDDKGKQEFLKEKRSEIRDQIVALIGALDVLDGAGVLVDQRLYTDTHYAVPEEAQEIFQEYISAATSDNPLGAAQIGFLNGLVHQSTGGLSLRDSVGGDFALPNDLRNFDPTQSVAENLTAFYVDGFNAVGATSAEDFENKINASELVDMIETLPFGTDERRAAFDAAMIAAFAAAKKADQDNADPNADITAILGTAFAESMQTSMEQINADPTMGADYLYIHARPIQIDPRMDEMSYGGFSVNEAFAEYNKQNQNAFEFEQNEALFIKGDDGRTYIGSVDLESRLFQVKDLNLEALTASIEAGNRDYESLAAISPGFDLVFQQGEWGTWSRFMSYEDFPRDVLGRIESFDALKQSIDTAVKAEAEALIPEPITPVGPAGSLGSSFGASAQGQTPSPVTEESFRNNAGTMGVQPEVHNVAPAGGGMTHSVTQGN